MLRLPGGRAGTRSSLCGWLWSLQSPWFSRRCCTAWRWFLCRTWKDPLESSSLDKNVPTCRPLLPTSAGPRRKGRRKPHSVHRYVATAWEMSQMKMSVAWMMVKSTCRTPRSWSRGHCSWPTWGNQTARRRLLMAALWTDRGGKPRWPATTPRSSTSCRPGWRGSKGKEEVGKWRSMIASVAMCLRWVWGFLRGCIHNELWGGSLNY